MLGRKDTSPSIWASAAAAQAAARPPRRKSARHRGRFMPHGKWATKAGPPAISIAIIGVGHGHEGGRRPILATFGYKRVRTVNTLISMAFVAAFAGLVLEMVRGPVGPWSR
jgi:hypothetical protein